MLRRGCLWWCRGALVMFPNFDKMGFAFCLFSSFGGSKVRISKGNGRCRLKRDSRVEKTGFAET